MLNPRRYQVSKQTLIGLPFELLLSGIDKLCEFPLNASSLIIFQLKNSQ